MRDKLEQVDNMLSLIQVSGDSVFTLVKARTLLKEIYDELSVRTQSAEDKGNN